MIKLQTFPLSSGMFIIIQNHKTVKSDRSTCIDIHLEGDIRGTPDAV